MATKKYTPLVAGATPTLGTSGDAVKALQTQLNTQNAGVAGYVPLKVDGLYGVKTQAASLFKPTSTGVDTKITSPADVTSPENASSFINGNQQNDFNTASSKNGDTPPVKASTQSYTDMFSALKESISPNTKSPETPNFTQQFKDLQQTQGITDLETSLNDLKAQAKFIKDSNAARKAAEYGKTGVPMNVIEGRASEEDRQDQIKLDAINREIEDTSNQLTTKYNVVNNLMTYSKLDYTSAVDKYDTEFTKNINLFNTVKGIVDTDKNNADKVADNARSNLQIIYNNITSNGSDLASLTADDKANITKLELQAGLPVGFYSSLQNKNPKGSILSTTTRDSNGTKYADILTRNDDGSLSVKSVALGRADKSSNDLNNAELLQLARAKVSPQIQAVRGADKYVSPDDYTTFRDAWTNTGLPADDFDKNFKQYANPESYSKLGISF